MEIFLFAIGCIVGAVLQHFSDRKHYEMQELDAISDRFAKTASVRTRQLPYDWERER